MTYKVEVVAEIKKFCTERGISTPIITKGKRSCDCCYCNFCAVGLVDFLYSRIKKSKVGDDEWVYFRYALHDILNAY